MLKIITLILSLALVGAGGVAVAVQNHFDNSASVSLQNYIKANNNINLNLQNSTGLFLKANTNPTL